MVAAVAVVVMNRFFQLKILSKKKTMVQSIVFVGVFRIMKNFRFLILSFSRIISFQQKRKPYRFHHPESNPIIYIYIDTNRYAKMEKKIIETLVNPDGQRFFSILNF